MDYTEFAGLTRLEPADPLSTDNYAFQAENPRIEDGLFRIGCVTHKHDGHAALANPDPAPSAGTLASGGTIPSDLDITVAYTLVDAYGGETTGSEESVASTQDGIATPISSPDLADDYTAGTLLAGTYVYAATVTDGVGGETLLGPTNTIILEPGNAFGRVLVSGLSDIVSESVGAGWRLWRAINGGVWTLVQTGTGDTVTDDGSLCADASAQPPSVATGSTNNTNRLRVNVPSGGVIGATSFRVYATIDDFFSSPALLGEYPLSSAGVDIFYTALDFDSGLPPIITRSIPGASQIDPDTDILDWHWKRPVASASMLPSGAHGDARVVLEDDAIYLHNGSIWVQQGGGGSNGHVIQDPSSTPMPQQPNLRFIGDFITVANNNAGSATVVSFGGASGHTIASSAGIYPQRPTLRFLGSAGVQDNAGNNSTDVTIPTSYPGSGGGGGGGATTKRYLASIAGLPSHSVRTRVGWDTAEYNVGSFTTADSGASIVIPETGLYQIDAKLFVQPNDNTIALYQLVELIACANPASPSNVADRVDQVQYWLAANDYQPYVSVHGQKYLTAGDKVSVYVRLQRQSDDADRTFDFMNNDNSDDSYISISKVS